MIIKLNRKIIGCLGDREEILNLLQGISSNDIKKISNTEVIYNLFLAPDGKFLFDNFIFLLEDKICIDCHPDILEKVIARIKKYRLGIKIKFEDLNLNCYSDLNNEYNFTKGIYKDTRADLLRSRIYSTDEFKEVSKEIDYHKFRVENYIPEGFYDLKENESIPIYFKMYELNAISLSKGCYIGQESTNRLGRKGVVRKELKNFVKKDETIVVNDLEYSSFEEIENFESLCSFYENLFGFIMIRKLQKDLL